MVLPVTGPFPSTVSSDRHFRNKIVGYRQAAPYNLPLAFNCKAGREEYLVGSRSFLQPISSTMFAENFPGLSRYTNAAQLAAYERLRGMVSDRALLGAAVAQMGQATSMIYLRASQLLEVVRKIRKLDFVGASASLKTSVVPKNVGVSKGFAGNWLEYSFGWVPLIGDIASACDVLQNPIKSIRPTAFGSGGTLNSQAITGSKPSGFYQEQTRSISVYARTGCEVTINNPNLFLLNNLGFANPGTVIWEVIPFSFVVDWFVPVESFLSSGTDWLGLGITNAYNTLVCKSAYFEDFRNPFWSSKINQRWQTQTWTLRDPGLYSPVIFVRPMKIPHWKRAANAVALLVQLLSGR